MSHTPRLLAVTAQPGYRLRLQFDDGTQGEVDLGEDVGKGVLASLVDKDVFSKVKIGLQGQVEWEGGIEICPDSLYLEVSGNTPEMLFPALKARSVA